MRWTYDAMDRVVTYTYNEQLLLSGMSGSSFYITGASYNALDKPMRITLGNGRVTDIQYCWLEWAGKKRFGAIAWIYTTKTGLPNLQDLQMTYDNVGKPTQIHDPRNGETISFGYDELDRLLSASAPINGSYSHNAIGNLLSKSEGGVTNTLDYTGTYPGGAPKHAPNKVNGVQQTYDNNGNLINRSGLDLKHDAENRMVKISQGIAYVIRLAYDGDGKRAKRVDNNGTIHYAGPHYERNLGNGSDTTEVITKLYYAQIGPFRRLVAFRRAGVLYFVHADHLGSSAIFSDVNGNETGAMRYQSYGQTRAQTGSVLTDKLYTGQTLDASSGLYFYGARYYDSGLGRFVQPDTIVPQPGNPQSLNRYAYGYNNPLKHTDPTGHYVEFVGGMGTDNDPGKNKQTWGFLIEKMGLKEGEYGFFDWAKGWTGPEGSASTMRPLSDAAGALREQIAGKTDVRLIGHSRGGALVLEYMAEVAEGKLPVNNQVRGAYSVDGALASVNSLVQNPFAGQRYEHHIGPIGFGDRYANLPSRLAKKGLTVDMATFDNPADFPFTTHDPVAGVPYCGWAVGPRGGESMFPLQYQAEAHGLLLTDRRLGAYLGGGYGRGAW